LHFQILLGSILVMLLGCHVHPSGELPPIQKSSVDTLNPTGTINGHRDIRTMTVEQLTLEKSNLESHLFASASDSASLRTLLKPAFEAFNFTEEAYLTGENDYSANGKLRRYSTSETLKRKLAKAIRDSPNFLLFHRHRLVRQQLLLPPYIEIPEIVVPIPTEKLVAIDAAGNKVITPTKDTLATQIMPNLAAKPMAEIDLLWTGAWRSNANMAIQGPSKFANEADCWDWGRKISGSYRENSYSFSVECSSRTEKKKQKLW
jgi:hypothetical protein